MVKLNAFCGVFICIGVSCHSVQGVLVEGSRWLLDGNKAMNKEIIAKEAGEKEIVLFFDFHNQPQWTEREKVEFEDMVTILKEYIHTDYKPLHILIEGVYNPNSRYPSILDLLQTRLDQEGLTLGIISENIEQRVASAIADDVIRLFPDYANVPRVSSTEKSYPNEVTLKDVLDEFTRIAAILEKTYSVYSDSVKNTYNRRMRMIRSKISQIESIIEKNSIPKETPLVLLLKECTDKELVSYEDIRILIRDGSKYFLDLYVLGRVLAISPDYTVVLIAGGEHSLFVQSCIMGSLNAEEKCSYGVPRTGEELKNPKNTLTTEQIKSLVYA